ncbi:SHOCT domain-containing protein [Yinghuangia aomiensis]
MDGARHPAAVPGRTGLRHRPRPQHARARRRLRPAGRRRDEGPTSATRRAATAARPSPGRPTNSPSFADLRANGTLSEEEFQQAKTKLLA